MDANEALELVRGRAGFRTLRETRRAVGATLSAFRGALDDDDARTLAAALPAEISGLIDRSASSPVDNAVALYRETERRERAGRGFAIEHARVVLEVLAEVLNEELVQRLRKHVPPEIAALLERRSPSGEPPPQVHHHPAHQPAPIATLSRGRPGAAEPIAEARGELAHTNSVARTSEPRAENMVATAHSTRPEHEDETMASSRGPNRRR